MPSRCTFSILGVVLFYQGVWYLAVHLLLVTTGSLPPGFYWSHGQPVTIQAGDILRFTPPDSLIPYVAKTGAFCVVKQVAARAGDEVCWSRERMSVGGQQWVRQSGHPVLNGWLGCRILTEQEVVVVGTHPQSLDSRDIGPIDRRRVMARVTPVWTWHIP